VYQKLTTKDNRKENIISTKIISYSGASFLNGSAKKIFAAKYENAINKIRIIIFEN